MTEADILGHIRRIVGNTLEAKGLAAATIEASTELLGGGLGIDSLDLAMLVRELEEAVGFDPFNQGFIEFRTAGELARLYLR